ncbi:MAG TPA: 3-hydroxyacyl-ACP dehydratase FabZ [bacterium]|nr:3-hydroxyacyl-ACP dehydratase FabZ [bacterium]
MDIQQILTRLPQRYPFLLVDRIVDMVPGERIVGFKNVSINEPFFAGHFPGNPVMPGVLVVEAMVQVAAILVSFRPDIEGRLIHLANLERVRFRRTVRPGDQLIMSAVALRGKGRFGKAHVTATVEGMVVAEGIVTYGLVTVDAVTSANR